MKKETKSTIVNAGDRCVFCGDDTSFGSGKFVNRIGADNYNYETDTTLDGYSCAECQCRDCDRCDELIPMDEDITLQPDDAIWEERVHYGCLNESEKEEYNNSKGVTE